MRNPPLGFFITKTAIHIIEDKYENIPLSLNEQYKYQRKVSGPRINEQLCYVYSVS